MASSRFSIEVREDLSVSAISDLPEAEPRALFIYAPGAGSNLNDGFGAHLGEVLPPRGVGLWRFQFPYMERGRSGPDPAALLEQTWRLAIDKARAAGVRTLVVGGRSMGGRIASQVVAAGTAVEGLVLFAYPLVPPGRGRVARTDHLRAITAPTLFCSGTRDSFATPEQLRDAATLVPGSSVHILEGADHGFAVLRSSGRTREDVWNEAADALVAFIDGLKPASK